MEIRHKNLERNRKMRDIVVTLPATVKWEDYEKELEQVITGEIRLNFKVPNFPKETGVGCKCYVVHKGFVRGWMEIVGFRDDDFLCEFTGKYWDGKFIERSGEFHYLLEPIPMKGFQGFRYFN